MLNWGEFMYIRWWLSLMNIVLIVDEIYGILGIKLCLKRSYGLKICVKEFVVFILIIDCCKCFF